MRFIESKVVGKRIVSLTPLIDVVFILLVFFMLVSNFNQFNAIAVNAPAPATRQDNSMAGALLIRLNEQGEIDIAGRPVAWDQLREIVRQALTEKPERQVLIKPHAELAIQQVVNLLDELAATGVTNFSFLR